MKYRPKILAPGLLGLALVVALASYLVGSILTSSAPSLTQTAPTGVESVTFKSKNGNISGWFAPADAPRGSIILLHGVRSNKSAMQGRMNLARLLNLNALAIDLQAHGESEGSVMTFGHLESLDAQAAVRYLKAKSNQPIFVVGVSLGGAAAVLSDPPLDVNGLILEAVYSDISQAISNRLAMRIPLGNLATPLLTLQLQPRLGITPDQLSPMLSAKHVTTPVIILNGSMDRHTTPDDAQSLYQAFRGDKQIEFFEGASHVDLLAFDKQRYQQLISAFITKHLPADR